MRILHTSDWHLGQHFMGKSRQTEHQALIDWLLQQVQAHAVDAVLIAGDIFDTGTPPSYARELCSQLVARLHGAGVALLLLGGNHDSVSVLEENQALLACLNSAVIAAVGPAAQHVVTLPLRAAGEGVGSPGPGCIVCALPFIRPRDVVQSQAGQTAQDKQQALHAALQATYRAVYEEALTIRAQLRASLGRSLPIIATGHLTTVGASSNDSVREIYVGTLEAFPTSAFPPVDYIALGHIHQPQKVGGLDHIRYCGSPIALGFDEARQTKQMLLVELGDGLQAVQALPVPVFQPMASVSGNLATLPALLQAAAGAGTDQRPVWLEVTVQDDDYLTDLAGRVQAMAQDLPLEVLRIKRHRGTQTAQLVAAESESLAALSPEEVFARRLAEETLAPELQQALQARYRSVLATLAEGAAA